MKFEEFRKRIETRDDIKLNITGVIIFYSFWIGIILLIVKLLPGYAWMWKAHGIIASIVIIGFWRYSWYGLNLSQYLIYKHKKYPFLKKITFKNPKFPKRVFFLIPSYKEDYKISRLTFKYLIKESYKTPSQVYFYVSVATKEETEIIKRFISMFDTQKRIKVVFLYQSQGKRVALAHGLRAIAREFYKPTSWHTDAKNDVIILMDGDSVVGKNALVKFLPFFKKFPKVGAVTTDEFVYYYGEGTKYLSMWYSMKFVKRHIMMSSHSIHNKVLTLTGRFSAFRAEILLKEDFINHVANDYISNWLFGKFRFLMGDDKSTWFNLLKDGWDMLYLPDVLVFALENRNGPFFKVTSSLAFRWNGNMLRNNNRALKLGPKKIGSFFIWMAILDQRISMFTAIFGPVGATLLSIFYTPFFWLFYIAWALIIKLIQFIPLIKENFTPKILHMLIIFYDQWIGSFIKIYASFNLAKQKWSKGKTTTKIELSIKSFPLTRKYMPFVLLTLVIIFYIEFTGLYTGIFHLGFIDKFYKFLDSFF